MKNLKKLIGDQNNLFVGIVIVFSVMAGLGITAYSSVETSSQNNSYDTYVQVNDSEGENISAGLETGGGMAFGEMVEGSNITKTLELSSSNLALVESNASGNISENLRFEEKVLFQNETGIEYMYVGEEQGYYEGEILLEIKTADNHWGEKWLSLIYRLPY